jgi:Phycobilisome protein
MSTNVSIRNHPQLKQMFIESESRHLDNSELKLYCTTLPEHINRAKAAHEIKLVQAEVVDLTVKEIFAMYPFLTHHELADGKAHRDINYVSTYVTTAMLMDDPEWLRDKFLIWLKTILQAFSFPERNKEVNLPTHRSVTLEADKMPQVLGRSAIYETYARLKRNFHQKVSPETYTLIEPLLQMSCDILASE